MGRLATSFNLSHSSVDLRCLMCGTKGVVIWEGRGEQKAVSWLSGQFYQRIAKQPPFAVELVCVKCGTMHGG